ncbi:MAG: hypothetical protein QOG62_16 [Thermoleophilaceae bacterium]|nr:hypothetical protein [Thermoleophilaceae bacterium]
MTAAEYVTGFALFTLSSCAFAGAAWIVVQRRLPGISGAARLVALGQMFAVALLICHIVPAMLGVMTRWTVPAASILLLAACTRFPQNGPEPDRQPASTAADSRPAMVAAVLAAVVAGVCVSAAVIGLIVTEPTSIDALSFHLPGVASWIQTGSIWQIDVFLPGVSPGHYPMNGDMLLAWAILPWRSDFLSHLAQLPFYALTAVAAGAIARELGAPRSASIVTGTMLVAMPSLVLPAVVLEQVDPLAMFGIGAGLLFLIREWRTGLGRYLAMAGLGLGLAFGTKWYAVSAVAIILAVWAIARLIDGAGLRKVIARGSALVALVLAAGGVWLLRNLVESGNPFYPVKLAPFGITIFDAPPDPIRDTVGATIASYGGNPAAWTGHILPQWWIALALPGFVLALGLVATTVFVLAKRLGRGALPDSALILAGGVAALLILLAYSITPYTAGPIGSPAVGADARYGTPALLIAAPMCAWLAARYARGPVVLAVIGLVATVQAFLGSLTFPFGLPLPDVRDWVIAVVALATATALWRLRDRLPLRPITIVAGIAVLAVLAGGGGWVLQKRFAAQRYVAQDPAVNWLVHVAPAGHSIGIAGPWVPQGASPILPAFGPRFENHVGYVGLLDQSTLRRPTDSAGFDAAVKAGRYDLLVVDRSIPAEPSVPEEGWAKDLGYKPVFESGRFLVLEAPGPA